MIIPDTNAFLAAWLFDRCFEERPYNQDYCHLDGQVTGEIIFRYHEFLQKFHHKNFLKIFDDSNGYLLKNRELEGSGTMLYRFGFF